MNGIRYRSADEMKDSGIEWIGHIPKQWLIHKLKIGIQEISRKGLPNATILSLYRDYGVINKDDRDDNFNRTSDDTGMYKVVNIDNLVINKMKAWQGSIAVSKYHGIISPAYYVYKLHKNLFFPPYLHYLLRNHIYLPEYRRLSGGIRPNQWDLNKEAFENIPAVFPDFQNQRRIANFLDIKTNQFDSIIAKKELLTTKLEEAKKSLISEVVTGKVKIVDGKLIPRQPEEMKDSGILWMGMVPRNWKKTRVKYELNFYDNIRIPLSSEERGKITEKVFDYYGASGVIDKVDDYLFNGVYILVGEDGANLYSRSTALAFIAKGKFWVNNHAHILKSKNGNDYYHVHLLETVDYYNFITGSAQPKLTQDNLASIRLHVPDDIEQVHMTEYLEIKLTKMNLVINSVNDQITLLKSAKQSLISEAVTGKIDLRDWEIIEQGGAS